MALNIFLEQRLELGYTQAEAGDLIGVTGQTIYRWEQAKDITEWSKKQYIYLFALKSILQSRKLWDLPVGKDGVLGEAFNSTEEFFKIDLRDFCYNLANRSYDYV